MQSCMVCEIKFAPDKYHPNQAYCSNHCRSKGGHRLRRGLSIKLAYLDCIVCDKKFEQKRANNTSYCSSECKRLAASRKFKGIPIRGKKKHIKGSGYINSQGYKIISRKHPNSSKRGQVLEHVVVMSESLGRSLFKGETVHHKNGIRNDNRIENLELWSHSHPFGQRVEDKVEWCKQFLPQYGYRVIKGSSCKNDGSY